MSYIKSCWANSSLKGGEENSPNCRPHSLTSTNSSPKELHISGIIFLVRLSNSAKVSLRSSFMGLTWRKSLKTESSTKSVNIKLKSFNFVHVDSTYRKWSTVQPGFIRIPTETFSKCLKGAWVSCTRGRSVEEDFFTISDPRL